jgi:pimeloyl-ACP methyl ester carboxylesterase
MSGAPAFKLLLAESLEGPKLLISLIQPGVPMARGDGRPVIVYPGFLANDWSTIRLRRSLTAANYEAFGWGLGSNWGAQAGLLDQLVHRLEAAVAQGNGRKANLIGWSLGGIYAREVAKLRPDLVDRVITLGSPFSGDMRANNGWWLYEFINDHPVDAPPLEIDAPVKPPVSTYAVWSPIDGVVAPASARGLAGESDRQIELRVRHLSLARAHQAIALIGDLLQDGSA